MNQGIKHSILKAFLCKAMANGLAEIWQRKNAKSKII